MADRVSQVGGANAGITLRMKTAMKRSAVSGSCFKSVIDISKSPGWKRIVRCNLRITQTLSNTLSCSGIIGFDQNALHLRAGRVRSPSDDADIGLDTAFLPVVLLEFAVLRSW
jgi:hypothetical protein